MTENPTPIRLDLDDENALLDAMAGPIAKAILDDATRHDDEGEFPPPPVYLRAAFAALETLEDLGIVYRTDRALLPDHLVPPPPADPTTN